MVLVNRKPAEASSNKPQTPAAEATPKDKPARGRPPKPDVWEYMANLTPKENEEVAIYLYRLDPQIARRPGVPNYLEQCPGPIDQAYVQKKYGGRVFAVTIWKDKKKIYDSIPFTIEAPVKWQSDEQPAAPVGITAPGVSGTQQQTVVEQMFGFMQRALSETLQKLEEANRAGRPPDVSNIFSTAMSNALAIQKQGYENLMEAKGAPTQGKSVGDRLVEKMMDKMVERMFGDGNAASPLNQIDSVLSVIEKLKEFSGSGQGQGSDAMGLAQTALKEIAPKLDTLANAWVRSAEIRRDTLAIERGLAVVPASPPAPPPPAVTETAPAPPSNGAAPVAEAPPVAGPTGASDQGLKALLVQYLFSGIRGDIAAEALDGIDPEWTAGISHQMANDPMLLANDPVFAPALGHPQLQAFVDAFTLYFAEGEDGAGAKPLASARAEQPAVAS